MKYDLTLNLRDFLLGMACMAIMVILGFAGYKMAEAAEGYNTTDIPFLECLEKKKSVIMREQDGIFKGEILRGCVE